MDKLSVRQGASLPIQLKLDEDEALTAELIVKQSVTDVTPKIHIIVPVENRLADLSIDSSLTDIDPGVYLYQVNVTYSDGSVEKYPETFDCDDDDDNDPFPTLTIIESL